MSAAPISVVPYAIAYSRLPLTVYREIAAHLRQIPSVQTGLNPMPCGNSDAFDYLQSQVHSLWVDYPPELSATIQPQLEQILNYYAERYGTWQVVQGQVVQGQVVQGQTVQTQTHPA
ncbi:MAG: hypothetical protein ACFBSC_19355 [Microcoleaceae cyanobacterium]